MGCGRAQKENAFLACASLISSTAELQNLLSVPTSHPKKISYEGGLLNLDLTAYLDKISQEAGPVST